MDNHQKITIQPPKKKVIKQTQTLLINYLEAKTLEKKKANFELFKKQLIKRKQTEASFNINLEMGLMINVTQNRQKYFFDVALERDDVLLFRLLMELGLSDISPEGIKVWMPLIYLNKPLCLALYFSQGNFSQYFIEGKETPLDVAVMFYNQRALEIICTHPQFDHKYLSYINSSSLKTPLCLAADFFNHEAVETLLNLNSPYFSNNAILTAFDYALIKFFDYYSKHKISEYYHQNTSFIMTNEVLDITELESVAIKKRSSIINTLYLLLNKIPEMFNFHQFNILESESNKVDLFNMLVEVKKTIQFSTEAFKLLLDILLSVGPGLCFDELPMELKNLYNDRPDSAEIVIPIISSDQKINYIYFYHQFEKYLTGEIQNYRPASALLQYVKTNLSSVAEKSEKRKFLENIQAIILAKGWNINYPDQESIVSTPLISLNTLPKETTLERLQKISYNLKPPVFTVDSLSFILGQKVANVLSIERHMIDESIFLSHEEDVSFIQQAITKNAYLVPDVYVNLIKLNEFFYQISQTKVRQDDERSILEAVLFFEKSAKKIDFYTLFMLYQEWKINKTPPSQMIEIINQLLFNFKLLDKKNHLNDKDKYFFANFRLQYFLYGMLVDVYVKNNQPELAKSAFKQAMLVLEASDNPDLFTGVFHNIAHHIIVIHIFKAVVSFGMRQSFALFHEHLLQIIKYETGMVLQKEFCKTLTNYIQEIIQHNQLEEANEILVSLARNAPKDGRIDIDKLERLKLHQIQVYSQVIEQRIKHYNLADYIILDIIKCEMRVDFSEIILTSRWIEKYFSNNFKCDNKILIINSIYYYPENEIDFLLKTVKEVIDWHIKLKAKQDLSLENKLVKLSLGESEENVLEKSMSFLTLYPSQRRERVVKSKIKKTDACSDLIHNEIRPVSMKDQIEFNLAEIKKMANLNQEYSDLIMIDVGYVPKHRRFLAIKNIPELNYFVDLCHRAGSQEAGWCVKSINPYGRNQHGVKLYREGKDYLIKIKGGSSDRAIGTGKEIDYQGEKIIVYTVDRILSHKKADKVFKL